MASPKLKVAYIMSRFPALTETFILYEMLALEKAGVDVALYPLLRKRRSVEHPEAQRMTKSARFQPFLSLPILRANWHYFRKNPGRYGRLLGDVLRHTFGSLNFFVGAIGIFPKSVRFAYEMEREGVDHVHAHFVNHPAVAAMIVNRLTGIPFSFTAHGSDLHVERRMLPQKVAASSFAVTISEYNREMIVRECGEQVRSKVHVIHCGIDPAVFAPIHTRPPAGGALRMVCVGSLIDVKGHRYLIDACGILRRKGIPFVCDLVGEGKRRRSLEGLVRSVGLGDHVRFHGGLPRKEVSRILGAADVAVLASVQTRNGKREGIPVVLMEAMATGLPVVASRISGIPELVAHGVTGVLVPPADPDSIATALEGLSRRRAQRLRMGMAGRNKVIAEFNLQRNADLLLARILAVHSSEAESRQLRYA